MIAELEEFDTIAAAFRPGVTDDLRDGGEACIGRIAVWEALWPIEAGRYEGQWAMRPLTGSWPFAWAPRCDLARIGEG